MESSRRMCRRELGIVILMLIVAGRSVEGRPLVHLDVDLPSSTLSVSRSLSFLVPSPQPALLYHNGPLLTGSDLIPVYLMWYGDFSPAQQSIIHDFFSSFAPTSGSSASVSSWWGLLNGYTNSAGAKVAPGVQWKNEVFYNYTKGKSILESDIQSLVEESLAVFPNDPSAIYFALTAEDVVVDTFCSVCGSHLFTFPSAATKNKQLPYAWVGNSASQCPGECAWPFAKAEYGPLDFTALIAPNGDIGVDGMIISIASLLAGIATDPFTTGYFEGDASDALEAGTACTGLYGQGGFSGYPGVLSIDHVTGASYNTVGANKREFLLPQLFDINTSQCANPP